MWFSSWEVVFKIAVSAVTGYALIILFLRMVGNRATSKMNNFDWIVTVAVGSLLASMVMMKDAKIVDGAVAIGTLLFLQYLVTLATSRWEVARRIFLAPPQLLFFEGKFLDEEMRKQRISRVEIISAIRESGIRSLDQAWAVTLEPNAELAVIERSDSDSVETIEDVTGYDRLQKS